MNLKYKILLSLFTLFVVACKTTKTTQIWKDQNGNDVPVEVTNKGNTTTYDFGVIVLYPDTLFTDTIK